MGSGAAMLARSQSMGGPFRYAASDMPPLQPEAVAERDRRRKEKKKSKRTPGLPTEPGLPAPAMQQQHHKYDRSEEYLLALAGISASRPPSAAERRPSALRSVASMSAVASVPLAAAAEDQPRVPVEFVYGDAGKGDEVALCGDWNSWKPIPMQRAQHSSNLFSVVTRVPLGYCEYCFCVNGEMRVSRGHLRNLQGSANWRTVANDRLRPRRTISHVEKPKSSAAQFVTSLVSAWHALPLRMQAMLSPAQTQDEESGSPASSASRGMRRYLSPSSLLECDDLVRAWVNMKPSELRSALLPALFMMVFMLVYILGYLYIAYHWA